MRVVPLSTENRGMTRLRTKGNARPDSLYDLLNAYITIDGSIVPRPGTIEEIDLPETSVGLVAHKCKLYTFNHEPAVTSNPDKYVVATLRHPTDQSIELLKIHFAAPFMGWLYVAAEFADGNIGHYWLEELDPWSPNTNYSIGDRVFPTVENGYAYEAERLSSPSQAWAPGVPRELGDVIEPTVYNGFKYTVVGTTGDNPASGLEEPEWPEESGATIIEFTFGGDVVTVTSPVLDPDPGQGSIPPEYSNPAGGFGPGAGGGLGSSGGIP